MLLMINNFDRWNKCKQEINIFNNTNSYIEKREIWWISFGTNVGVEINGKNGWFTRPALIIEKLSSNQSLVAPISKTNHRGTWFFELAFKNISGVVCLHQIRTIDHKRIRQKINTLPCKKFEKIMDRLFDLYFD